MYFVYIHMYWKNREAWTINSEATIKKTKAWTNNKSNLNS